LIEHCWPRPHPKFGLRSSSYYHRWIQTVTLEMKTGLSHLTMLLYPVAWKTKEALLENGYGMEIDAKSNDGYTGCNRRNGPDFGRVFLTLNYTDITQNTYIQS